MKRMKVGGTAVMRSLQQRGRVCCALLGALAPGFVILAAVVLAPAASQCVHSPLSDASRETTEAIPPQSADHRPATVSVQSLPVFLPAQPASERRDVAALLVMDPVEATANGKPLSDRDERSVLVDQGMNLWVHATVTTLILARPYHLPATEGTRGRVGEVEISLRRLVQDGKLQKLTEAQIRKVVDDFVANKPDNQWVKKLRAADVDPKGGAIGYDNKTQVLTWSVTAKAGSDRAGIQDSLGKLLQAALVQSTEILGDTEFEALLKSAKLQVEVKGSGTGGGTEPPGGYSPPVIVYYECIPCYAPVYCQPCCVQRSGCGGFGLFRGRCR